MIKIEELRPGNFIKAGEVTVKIESIDVEIVNEKDSIMGIEYPMMTPNPIEKRLEYKIGIPVEKLSEYCPIPLSDSVLITHIPNAICITSSFVAEGECPLTPSFSVGSIMLQYISSCLWEAKYRIGDTCRCKTISSVHQLQNLYFELTDQELEVNL